MEPADQGRQEGTADSVDEIEIIGIRAFGHHGVYEHERRDGQEFVVDVRLRLTAGSTPALTDDVADTVHYGEVAEQVVAIVRGAPVHLIETLAARIADTVVARERVAFVSVTVHKPQAPIPVPFADVRVTATRVRREQ
jgi:dihydroneopterin aldolase